MEKGTAYHSEAPPIISGLVLLDPSIFCWALTRIKIPLKLTTYSLLYLLNIAVFFYFNICICHRVINLISPNGVSTNSALRDMRYYVYPRRSRFFLPRLFVILLPHLWYGTCRFLLQGCLVCFALYIYIHTEKKVLSTTILFWNDKWSGNLENVMVTC